MKYNEDEVDRAVLALLSLTMFEVDEYGGRTWKSHCWDAMNRLHEKGFIADPKSKSKSVHVLPKGVAESERLFQELFGTDKP